MYRVAILLPTPPFTWSNGCAEFGRAWNASQRVQLEFGNDRRIIDRPTGILELEASNACCTSNPFHDSNKCYMLVA